MMVFLSWYFNIYVCKYVFKSMCAYVYCCLLVSPPISAAAALRTLSPWSSAAEGRVWGTSRPHRIWSAWPNAATAGWTRASSATAACQRCRHTQPPTPPTKSLDEEQGRLTFLSPCIFISKQECNNKCCDAATCRFTRGSACADGNCCDNCQVSDQSGRREDR